MNIVMYDILAVKLWCWRPHQVCITILKEKGVVTFKNITETSEM